jgi:2-methylcitrate dehydratase PrpD
MSSNENLSLRFAEQLIALGRSTLSAPDSEQIRRLMLDALGVMLRGSGLPLSLSMRDWAKQFSQSGRAPVVAGGFTTAPAVAALVNATATHSYELDDTHDASMSHPGSVVIATALAMVAGTSISQAKLFSAIAAGYETIARVGMAANASLVIKAGFHPTALFGPFGAATTAAILQDVDAPTLACAWGHVLSLTGGSMQFSDETQGTEIKRLHAGYAAQNGILAAGMAFRGISAPSRALDGKYGFLIMYGHDIRPEHLDFTLGDRLQIHEISMKPYSCCRLFHSLIDALEQATNGFSLEIKEIARIQIGGPAVLLEQHMLRRPTSVMAAQYSLPYAAAVTLAYGPYRFDAYSDPYHQDMAILSLVDKIEAHRDLTIEATYPEHMGASVEIYLNDGSVRQALVMDSKGTSRFALTNAEILHKANSLVQDLCPQYDMAAAYQKIWAETPRASSQILVDLFKG